MMCGSLLLKITSKLKVCLIMNVLAFYFCSNCYILPSEQANSFDENGLPKNSLGSFFMLEEMSLNFWRVHALEGNVKDDEVVWWSIVYKRAVYCKSV